MHHGGAFLWCQISLVRGEISYIVSVKCALHCSREAYSKELSVETEAKSERTASDSTNSDVQQEEPDNESEL